MNKTIDQYLKELKNSLSGSDKAIIQDATADAHEHLVSALQTAQAEDPTLSEEQALQKIIADYGTPEETASAYQQAEFYTTPYLATKQKGNNQSALARFFSIYGDPAAWGSFLYMIISIIIGGVYFTWAIYGVSLSLIFALFIFGLPFSVLFILSTQGFAWLEGRIVEGMLGVRMPRRPIFFPKEGKWIDRLKMYLRDKRTWFTLLYMILLMPMSIVYVLIWTLSFGFSIILIGSPIIQEVFHLPMVTLGSKMVFMPLWSLPFMTLLGIVLLTAFLHLAKKIGQFHGRFAKRMLVTE